MNLQILQADPLNILDSTESVMKDTQFVKIDEDRVETLASKVVEKFGDGLNRNELGFGSTGDIENDIQLTFIENVVNFCFWPSKGQPKREVEWPTGNIVSGGWYGLVACFKRGLAENIPILNAEYLRQLTPEDARHFFRSENNIEIPLLQERINNLREAGTVLREKFDGKVANLIEVSDYDAIKITKVIVKNFSSFRDISILNGKEVIFLKRAQICPNDFAYALKGTAHEITSLDKLTAYADYKLPQLLRMFGIFKYEESLAEKIDALIEIPHDSREEIEIRAATIWGVELLRQKIKKMTAGEIDNTLWVLSQAIQAEEKPHHRTRTIYY
jgi:hypothetical protein